MEGMEWREMKPGEWWLVFSDAPPDLGRSGPIGYPPSMTISWTGDGWACCHIRSYYNGAWPDDESADDDDCDYIHVCGPRDLIAELEAWMKTAAYVSDR